MPQTPPAVRVALLAAAVTLAACTDSTAPAKAPPARPTAAPTLAVALRCEASLTRRAVTCDDPAAAAAPAAPAAPGMASLIAGGQGQYVKLASSNVAVVADTFAFDLTVQNLIMQPLGTTSPDTTAPRDADGVRVFFASGPSSTGAGTLEVANPAGLGTFLATGEPYFQFDTALVSGRTSAPERVKIRFSPEVTSFTFTVYVAAAVPYPSGYVSEAPRVLLLDPNESLAIGGSIRNAVGVPQAGTITFSSADPAVASVSGNVVTAGGSMGATPLGMDAGGRPGYGASFIAVCPSVAVASGSSVPASLGSGDCFAMLHPQDLYRPSTTHYADLYRLTLTAGQVVTITLDNGSSDGLSGLDTYLVLADQYGGVWAENDDDRTGPLGLGSRIEFTVATSGTYLIMASSFAVGDTGSYTLGVSVH